LSDNLGEEEIQTGFQLVNTYLGDGVRLPFRKPAVADLHNPGADLA
jgi:hypothetical protein